MATTKKKKTASKVKLSHVSGDWKDTHDLARYVYRHITITNVGNSSRTISVNISYDGQLQANVGCQHGTPTAVARRIDMKYRAGCGYGLLVLAAAKELKRSLTRAKREARQWGNIWTSTGIKND